MIRADEASSRGPLGALSEAQAKAGQIEQAESARPAMTLDTPAIARRFEKRLKQAEFAARLNAETIGTLAEYIRELEGKLARIRPAIEQMFREAVKVQIPTIIVRDFCELCGLRFLPDSRPSCVRCDGLLQRDLRIPFDSPLSDLIDDEGISIETLGGLIADVALGVSHLEENDEKELVIRKVK